MSGNRTVEAASCEWVWAHNWNEEWVEHRSDERLREYVSDVVICAYVSQCDGGESKVVANEMVFHLDMLGPRMFTVIRRQRDCRLIVGVENRCKKLRETEVVHEVTVAEPDEFLRC